MLFQIEIWGSAQGDISSLIASLLKGRPYLQDQCLEANKTMEGPP